MHRKLTLIILAALFSFACSPSVDNTYPLEISSRLKDLGTISMRMTVEFENEGGLQEIKKKEERIKRAFSLILREYSTEKLQGKSKRTATKVLRKILDSEIKSKVLKFEIAELKVLDRNGKET